jgi:hypothetical protein
MEYYAAVYLHYLLSHSRMLCQNFVSFSYDTVWIAYWCHTWLC